MSQSNEAIYDAWGQKFDKSVHMLRKGVPAQDREGRWKFTRKARREFEKARDQQEFPELKNVGGRRK